MMPGRNADWPYGARERAVPSFHDRCRSNQLSRRNLWICQPQRQALLIRNDLLERLTEIELVVRPFGPAKVGCAQHIWHGEERVIAVHDRLMLVNIDGGVAGPAPAQRGEQRPRRNELGARGVDEQCSRLHAIELARADDALRLTRQSRMQ